MCHITFFFFAYAKNSSSGDIKRGETVQATTICEYQLCKFGLEVLGQEADFVFGGSHVIMPQ